MAALVASDEPGLQNRYFAVRHGQVSVNFMCTHYTVQLLTQAESNVQKIIVSNPAIGADAYGLTDLGMEQAKQVKSHCTG